MWSLRTTTRTAAAIAAVLRGHLTDQNSQISVVQSVNHILCCILKLVLLMRHVILLRISPFLRNLLL